MPDETDLRDLLEAPLESFPDRPNLPGSRHFNGKLTEMSAVLSRQKQTPGFRFDAQLTSPGADVKPDQLKPIADAGFSLSDYSAFAEFWVTPGSMPILRRFLETLGFDMGKSLRETLALDENYNPTAKSQELIRGREVLCETQAPDDRGRVFSRLESMVGLHKK